MKTVLLGPPGSGKGTQAQMLAEKIGEPQIATGDIFRAEIQGGTPLGGEVKSYMDRGALVPDEIVIDLIRDRTKKQDCSAGYILDGFPRTITQAEALDRMLSEAGGGGDRFRRQPHCRRGGVGAAALWPENLPVLWGRFPYLLQNSAKKEGL